MADITKERLAELLKYPQNLQVEEVRPLIAMAARSVSEETVLKLLVALSLETKRGATHEDIRDAFGRFYAAALNNLRKAAMSMYDAESLAKEGGERG
jgi:hypothetical protein